MQDLLVSLGGHIDHGKTSLIKALNGFDGDESKEEKQRGITLDISFSNLKLPNRNVAFIDVPGHEKLVKNMIAGAFATDILLLVIALDDGIMPQSVEHLEIANFLKIPQCLCIITKTDKGDMQAYNRLCIEITQLFAPLQISLEKILPFSIASQEQDKIAILDYLNHIQKSPKKEIGFFRYYIDQVLSISGAGCVVRGSSLSGEVKKGDKLLVYDLNQEVTIKAIKIHSDFTNSALPSHRVALNLAGVNANELKRGYLIAQKGYLRGFDSLDVILYTPHPIPPYANLHIGSKRTNAKITILQKLDENKVLATLKTQDKIFALFKDSFVLRDNNQTLCGGEILAPITDPIKKSQKIKLLKFLLQEDFISAFALLCEAHIKGFGLISSTQRFGLSHTQALEIAKSISSLFIDSKNLVLYSSNTQERLMQNILQILHKNPDALLSASSLKIKYPWASEILLQYLLDKLKIQGKLKLNNGLFSSTQTKIKNAQDFLIEKIYSILCKQGFSPLAPYNIYETLDIDRKSGDDALKKLCSSHKVIRLEHNLFITTNHLNQILALMRNTIKKRGYIDINNFKEILPLSRKYLITYLDYLDSFDDIIKVENKRIFRHQK